MTDASEKLQTFTGSVITTERQTVSRSPGLEPNTPSPRKKFTRKNKTPTSTYSMFSNLLEQEVQQNVKAQKAAEAKKAAKAQKKAEARAAAEQAAAAPRPKRQRRPRAFHGDDEDATLSRNRAGPGQKGKGPDEQPTSGSDAEGSAADQKAAAEPSQEDMLGDGMSEDSREVTGGLQGGAQPDPNWGMAEAGSAMQEEKRKAKRADRKKGNKTAGRRSVKELLDDMGVRAQKQTDPEFIGVCPYCDGDAKPWRHAARAPYTGKLVCNACGVWERRHPNQSLLEQAPKAGRRGMNCQVQDIQESDDGAALQSDRIAGMDDLAQAALAAASSGMDDLAQASQAAASSGITQLAQMPQPAHGGPALAAASHHVAMPLSQLTAVIALHAAKHAVQQQEVQHVAEVVMGAGQQVANREQGHEAAAASSDVQGNVHSRSMSTAHQPSATISAHIPVAAGKTAEQMEVRSAEGGAAVVAQEAIGGEQQPPVAIASSGVWRVAEGGSMWGGGDLSSNAGHAAAHEVMGEDGAAQQSAADAIDTVTAEQQAAGTGVGSGSPEATGSGTASAAILTQHAGVEAIAAQHGTHGAKRAAGDGEVVYSKRRKANDNSRLEVGNDDSAAELTQLDTDANADLSMRRTVRRRGVSQTREQLFA